MIPPELPARDMLNVAMRLLGRQVLEKHLLSQTFLAT